MNDHSTNGSGTAEAVSADIDAASRRLMTALDALDGSLVKSRKLERTNREIAERLDAAIGTIRSVLDAGETS
jgi:hypothetical protein